MRAEKTLISQEYLARLNRSPFVIVVDYTGLKVTGLTELRKRLTKCGAEVHVVKNSLFRLAAQEAGLPDLGTLTGQLAAVTGQKDVCAAAKALKGFEKEFERPKLRFGFLGAQRLDVAALQTLASLPPVETLRGQFLGLLQQPATRLVALLNTPASQLARVLKAKTEQAAAPA
jgi:large subunit ribosomal protein L10